MRKFGVAVAVGALSALVAGGAFAAGLFPSKAQTYSTWLVRAFNQCTPSGLSVTTAQSPTTGCLAVLSDGVPPLTPLGATMNFAKLTVRRFPGGTGGAGKIKIIGRGFQAGQRVSVRLTLRDTKFGQTVKHPPGTNKLVTFADTTIDCGTGSMGCFLARPNGSLAGSQSLLDCIIQNGQAHGLATGNIEIVNASLVNCDTGNTVAVPGILN